MRNTSRAWAYETGVAAGVELGPGTILLAHPQINLNFDYRNTCERVLRVLWTRLRTRRQVLKYRRSQHPNISRKSETDRSRKPKAHGRCAKCTNDW